MTKLQLVARAILEAEDWLSTSSIAEIADMDQRLTASYACNLRNRRLIESESINGAKAMRHRALDRAGLEEYIAEDRIQGRRIDAPMPVLPKPAPRMPLPNMLSAEPRTGLTWAI